VYISSVAYAVIISTYIETDYIYPNLNAEVEFMSDVVSNYEASFSTGTFNYMKIDSLNDRVAIEFFDGVTSRGYIKHYLDMLYIVGDSNGLSLYAGGNSMLFTLGGTSDYDFRTDADSLFQIGDGSYAWGHTPQFGVEGIAEFDAAIYTDDWIHAKYYVGIESDNEVGITFGGTVYNSMINQSTTNDQLAWFLNSNIGNQLVIGQGNYAERNDDFDHVPQINPTLYVHSATDPDTNNTQWISITHDQTNGVIDVGTGNITFNDPVYVTGSLQIPWDYPFYLGDVGFNTNTTYDQFLMWTEAGYGEQFVFGDYAHRNKDYDHSVQDNPTLYIQSKQDPDIDNTQWFSLSYSSANDRAELHTNGDSKSLFIGSTDVKLPQNSSLSVTSLILKSPETDANIFYIEPHTSQQIAMYPYASANRALVIGDVSAAGQNYDHASQTNPTLFIHSATTPNTNNTQWISLTHNQTNGVIDVGTGNIVLNDPVSINGSLDLQGSALYQNYGVGYYWAGGEVAIIGQNRYMLDFYTNNDLVNPKVQVGVSSTTVFNAFYARNYTYCSYPIFLYDDLIWATDGTNTTKIEDVGVWSQLAWLVGSNFNRNLILGGVPSKNYDHTIQTNPTLYIHSATDPDVNNTQWISLKHDQTNGIIEVGTGELKLVSDTSVSGSMFTVGGSGGAMSITRGYGGQFYGWTRAYQDDGLHFMLGSGSPDGESNRNLIITDYANGTKNHDHSTLSADPTLFIHSATDPDTFNNQWFSMSYSAANHRAEFYTGGEAGTEFYFNNIANFTDVIKTGWGIYFKDTSPSTYSTLLYHDSVNGDALHLTLGSGSAKNFIIDGLYYKNYDHAAQTNPTLWIHSATDPDSDNTQWMSFTHNQSSGTIATGKGGIRLMPANGIVDASGYELQVDTIAFTGSPVHSRVYWNPATQTLVFTSSITAPGVSGGGGGGVAELVTYTVGTATGVYNGSTTVFDLPFAFPTDSKTLQVYYNGVMMTPVADYTETDINEITFVSARTVGSKVTCRAVIASTNPGVPELAEYTAGWATGTYTGSLTVFDLPFTYAKDGKSLFVFNDGIMMRVNDDYTETDFNTVTFTIARSSGSYVTFRTNTGNGWVGTAGSDLNMLGYSINDAGVVSASTFTLTNNATCYYSITPLDFTPITDTQLFTRNYTGYSANSATVESEAMGPFHLPNGAVITRVRMWAYRDDAASQVGIRLYRTQLTSYGVTTDLMAECIAPGTGGNQIVDDTSITNPTIDNTNYGYQVYLSINPNDAVTDAKFFNVQVQYYIATLLP
jgi:hypothetical protein